MSARRPVALLLSIQAVALLLLTSAAGATWWTERVTVDAEVESIQRRTREIRDQAAIAALEPYAFGASRDPKHIDEAAKAVAQTAALVSSLKADMAGQDANFTAMGQTLDRMTEVIGVMTRVSTTADLSGALQELTDARVKLETQLRAVEMVAQGAAREHFNHYMQVTMLLWGGMLLVMLATGLAARRGVVSNELSSERERRQLTNGLTGALEAALEGKEAPAPLAPIENYRSVYDAVSRAITTLDELRKSNVKMARRTTFLKDIQDALSMAENEDQVLNTGYRAAGQAYPRFEFSMLLVDSTAGRLAAHRNESKRPCTATDPGRCPAIDKGRTLHHRAGDGEGSEHLARCSYITDPSVSVSCAPLHVIGTAAAVAQLSHYPHTETAFDDLEALALAVASRLGVVRSLAERTIEANTDALTGLSNRRILNDRLSGLDSANIPYTVVLCDLDHFKKLNDTFGHEAGDRCLQTFADVLRRACRDSDVPCRLGGEEFVLLLPGAGMRAGLSVALRIRTFLAEACAKLGIPFTASLGVASRPDHGNTGEAVLRAADAAMYDAKEGGRDQVVPARALPLLEGAV